MLLLHESRVDSGPSRCPCLMQRPLLSVGQGVAPHRLPQHQVSLHGKFQRVSPHRLRNNLNIHGLWLQYGSAEKCAHPGDCLNIPFDPNSLSAATKNDLTYHWVGVFNPSNGFHDHEWTKHGTCYEKEMTSPSRWLRYFEELGADAYQEKFFRQVITLNQQHAAMQLLKAQGIVPSRTVGYTTVNMLRALGTTTSSSLLACQVDL